MSMSRRGDGRPVKLPADSRESRGSVELASRRDLERRGLRTQLEVLLDNLAPRVSDGAIWYHVSVRVLGHGVPPQDYLVVNDVRHSPMVTSDRADRRRGRWRSR